MAEVQEKESGKKKKGAQKKMTIRVDFTPMVDMNMLLITFFMLCTTMIKSQTLKIILPTDDPNIKKEQLNQAKNSEALTIILDTEYDAEGKPVVDANGKTLHHIYWYDGIADTLFTTKNFLNEATFVGDTRENGVKIQNGIRKVLHTRNDSVMARYERLKQEWRDRKITKEAFDSLAKLNRDDSTLQRPVVVIKPGPNTTYEGLISALDEMQINQIARYNIQPTTHVDTMLLMEYQRREGRQIIRDNVRK